MVLQVKQAEGIAFQEMTSLRSELLAVELSSFKLLGMKKMLTTITATYHELAHTKPSRLNLQNIYLAKFGLSRALHSVQGIP
jgi:hypothetical protein